MFRSILLVLTFLFPLISFGQNPYVIYQNLIINDGIQNYKNPFAGGLNEPQISSADLNNDGWSDLFLFDRSGNKAMVFTNDGIAGQAEYTYDADLASYFPPLTNWALLRDYNCDGKADIFTSTDNAIKIYRNVSSASGPPTFQLMLDSVYTSINSVPSLAYCNSQDLPGIEDIDGDGDIDFLLFDFGGQLLEYHKNLSADLGYGCDSLIFKLEDACWGKFSEDALNNTVTLNITCPGFLRGSNTEKSRHAGSTVALYDIGNDGTKDAFLGDISFDNIVYLENGGTPTDAFMVSSVYGFPDYDIPVNIERFPAAFFLDADNDGLVDMLAAPSAQNVSDNFTGIWFYKNTGTNANPVFEFQTSGFLQETMIECGAGTTPRIVDANGDLLQDLVIGNYSYRNGTVNYSGLTLLLNTGTSTNPEYTLNSTDWLSISSLLPAQTQGLIPAFGDLDNDGDQDVIIGDADGKISVFTNTAGVGNPIDVSLSSFQYNNIDVGAFANPQIIDLDRDGLLDLVIGRLNGSISYFRNIGTANAFNFSSTPDNTQLGQIDVMIPCCTGYASPWIIDNFSANGQYSLFTGSETGEIYYYNNIDGNLSGAFTQQSNSWTGSFTGIRTTPVLGDLTSDGIPELVVSNYRGGLTIYKQSASNVSENIDNKLCTLYPNPFRTELTLQFPIGVEALLPEIHDISGRLVGYSVFSKNNQTISINISGNSGIYFLHLPGTQFTFKIVKLP